MIRDMPAYTAATLIVAAVGPSVAETIWPAPTTPPQINVTSDSTQGWLPSQEQIAEVHQAADAFFAAKDEGRSAEAYALLTDVNRQQQPFGGFSDAIVKFNLQAGAVKERRVVLVTWTKDPAQAPAPGVYAALDTVSRFANIDRHCGFLILYQPPSGGEFRVMREENTFIENVTARVIEQEHSHADLDSAWSRLSANCPNYPAAPAPPLPEQPQASVGYSTVAAALQGLHASPSVKFSSQAGWMVADDEASKTIWSFAPPGDPAYPAVVRRQVVQNGTAVGVQMNVLCQATKSACDNLVRQFEQLNARMRASWSSK